MNANPSGASSAHGATAADPAALRAATRIALIGYGEVGQTLAADLCAANLENVVAWDRLFTQASSAPSRAAADTAHVRPAAGMASALAGRTVVISAVTAGECVSAAREAAAALAPGAYYFDLNSVAPETKVEAARAIEAAGGRYVEAAVMSPIGPKRIASPMLIGGPHAARFEPLARALGFTGVEVYGDAIGRASAAKMCRSVMIKGIEALLTESLLSARHYGVEATVLRSLQDLLPGADWPNLARYMISRSLLHGRRRAEEMREVARTVADAGLEPWMSAACAHRQDWAAAHAEAQHHVRLDRMLDAVLADVQAAPSEKTA
jgi:3-hydroxyisobutyrate dehydrogenase-like beta-hydroxyacid dehydrogenase